MCFWNWKIILILGPATPLNFMCGLGGGSQNSSQTSSSEVWFDDQVWNGISSSWRRNPLDTSEVIGTHCVLPPYANCRSDDCLANISASDCSWRTHCEDYTGQLSWEARLQWSFTAASNFHSHWGRGERNTRQEVICKSLPPFHQYSSWLKVYSRGLKDDCTIRLGKWILRNEQVSHLSINQLTLVGGVKQVKGCSVYSRLLC